MNDWHIDNDDRVLALHRRAGATDAAYSAALTEAYGDDAGNARYDARGSATIELSLLRMAARCAKDAVHDAVTNARRVNA